MKEVLNVHIKRSNLLLSILFGICVFIFFNFYYPFHVQYQEQFQMFLFTKDYFLDRVSLPGGLAIYLGNFFVQFFYYAWLGALVIAFLLVLLQREIVWLTKKFGFNNAYYPLTLLPSIVYWILLCDENYMLSGLLLLIMVLATVIICTTITSRTIRLISTIVLTPVLYILCSGCFWLFALFMILLEIFYWKQKIDIRWWIMVIGSVLLIFCSPIISKNFYQYPLERLWLGIGLYRFPNISPYGQIIIWLLTVAVSMLPRVLPKTVLLKKYITLIAFQVLVLVIGGGYFIKNAADWDKEEIMGYDHHVRMQEWDKVIAMADKKVPTAPMSVACLNLALSKTGQLADKMFCYYQNGVQGLIPPFQPDFTSPLPTSEIYYHLGMINSSQRLVFEAMESIPDYQKSARCYKCLAETNLINGQYKVAAKYLRALQHTLFYRDWATETLTYLNNESRINAHPEWGRLRQLRYKEDFLYSQEELDIMLGILFKQNNSNRMAYEYLMACTLLSNNLDHFFNYYPLGKDVGYQQIPKSYQEALLFIWSLKHHPLKEKAPWPVSEQITERLLEYAPIYLQDKNAEPILKERFGDTYWYYLHFGTKKL